MPLPHLLVPDKVTLEDGSSKQRSQRTKGREGSLEAIPESALVPLG